MSQKNILVKCDLVKTSSVAQNCVWVTTVIVPWLVFQSDMVVCPNGDRIYKSDKYLIFIIKGR